METYSELVVNCPEMQLRLALRTNKVGGQRTHRKDDSHFRTSSFILDVLAVIMRLPLTFQTFNLPRTFLAIAQAGDGPAAAVGGAEVDPQEGLAEPVDGDANHAPVAITPPPPL